MKKCCVDCINDFYLLEYVMNNGKMGKCDFCKSTEVECISLNDGIFKQMFNLLRKMYIKIGHPYSRSIMYFIDEKWKVFSEENLYMISRELCKVHDFDCKAYYFLNPEYDYYTRIWTSFKNKLKSEYRYMNKLPKEIEDLLESNSLLSNRTIYLSTNSKLYRARLGGSDKEEDRPYPKSFLKMGMPPKEKARPGRANPEGISYLYLASDIDTAIKEVRPWNDSKVSVAMIKPKSDISLLNLSQFDKGNLFLFTRGDEVEFLTTNYFIYNLSLEISKPISVQDSYLDYIPTQFLSEFIKSKGYSGFIFDSSLGLGQNVVFFKQDKLKIVDVELYFIKSINYNYECIY